MDTFECEPLADDVDRLVALQQQRRAGMPQAVELDPAHACGLDQPGVLSLPTRR
jgi:hypothetical protein